MQSSELTCDGVIMVDDDGDDDNAISLSLEMKGSMSDDATNLPVVQIFRFRRVKGGTAEGWELPLKAQLFLLLLSIAASLICNLFFFFSFQTKGRKSFKTKNKLMLKENTTQSIFEK